VKFLFVLAQLGAAVYMNKHEPKCSLLIVLRLLLFYTLH